MSEGLQKIIRELDGSEYVDELAFYNKGKTKALANLCSELFNAGERYGQRGVNHILEKANLDSPDEALISFTGMEIDKLPGCISELRGVFIASLVAGYRKGARQRGLRSYEKRCLDLLEGTSFEYTKYLEAIRSGTDSLRAIIRDVYNTGRAVGGHSIIDSEINLSDLFEEVQRIGDGDEIGLVIDENPNMDVKVVIALSFLCGATDAKHGTRKSRDAGQADTN